MSGISRRHLSTSAVTSAEKKRKIVVIGAGFVGELLSNVLHVLHADCPPIPGSYIAKALISDSRNTVVLASRNPDKRKSLTGNYGKA